MLKTAVLLTCYNRKEKTLNCLRSLYTAIDLNNFDIKFEVYLVDDNSSDGTSEEISIKFPKIYIIKGSGNLYWAGGMRLAWETALKKDHDYDFFLLLNDDVILTNNFIYDLLNTHEYCKAKFKKSGIYVCSTMDSKNSKISYGGTLIIKRGINIKSVRIHPSNVPIPCSVANANILMVAREVVKVIGILDPNYLHDFADYDYTLLASSQGFPVLVSPGFGGYCVNDHGKRWLSSDVSFKERLNYLYSIKGISYRDHSYYLKKNFKFQFPYYFVLFWLKTIFPFIWDKFKKNRD